MFGGVDGNNPAISGDLVDLSGDGIPNLLAYALGLNPTNSAGQLLTVGTTNDFLTLTYLRPHPAPADLLYLGEVSDALLDWMTNTVESAIDNGNGTETVTTSDTVPTSSTNQRFIRLRVIREY